MESVATGAYLSFPLKSSQTEVTLNLSIPSFPDLQNGDNNLQEIVMKKDIFKAVMNMKMLGKQLSGFQVGSLHPGPVFACQ